MPDVPAPLPALEVWCDVFPAVSETFVLAEARTLEALGHPVRVCAGTRGDGTDDGGLPLDVIWEESTATRLRAMAAVAVRHPVACVRDLVDRRRWRREEPVPPLRTLAPAICRLAAGDARIHAHFATAPALRALRVSRVLGRPWSLTAHAWDIYRSPANLPEKLRCAALVTSGCAYTVHDLRELAGPQHADRVHEIVMGVDAAALTRTMPAPHGRTIVAVGRLVPKKGFAVLLEALAQPALVGAQLVLVGGGPEEDALRAQAARLGLDVRFTGELTQAAAVRSELERADVLAMPCVIAPDGDRDSMPVVVKEAMAMELPVVVSDAIGLPELVRPAFGRIVGTGDPVALAAGLADVLAASPAARAAMGAAGRAHVIAHADLITETGRLSRLLAGVRPLRDPSGPGRTPSAPTD